MIEGSSSHHVLSYKDSNENNLSKDELPPVVERLEEYISQNNDDQKMFSRTSAIIKKDDTNKETMKDTSDAIQLNELEKSIATLSPAMNIRVNVMLRL